MEIDYISREAALACFHDWIDRYGHEHSADEMIEYHRIEDLPAADVVEVVRCGECRHRTNGWPMCKGRPMDWFCAAGWRRPDTADK